MKKLLFVMLAAGSLAAAGVTAPVPAQAASTGDVVAAGVGGFALGTFLGLSAPRPVYVAPAPVVVAPAPVVVAPAPGYVVYTGYRARVPVACAGGGYWARKPVAFDRAGRPVAWSKPRYFCH